MISYKFFAVLWSILLIIASLIPGSTASEISLFNIKGIDKVGHVCMYAGLSYLWLRAWAAEKQWSLLHILYLVLGFIVMGTILEFLQSTSLVNRSFELADIVSNSFGVVIGWIIYGLQKQH